MGGVTGETNASVVEKESEKETVNVQPSQEVVFGELAWVKVNETSWWPAQVVDENSVSSANKPSSKGSSGDILVRLYGCYIYKYVDIENSNAEFKNMQIDKNFNYGDILKKSMEQDLSSNSNKSRKRQPSKSKVLTEASPNRSSDKSQSKVSSKKQKQEKSKTAPGTPQVKTKNTNPSSPNILNHVQVGLRPQELSARRMKVMQSLGLAAPSGSPFPRSPPVLN